jgi:hypothetical protein
VSPFPPQTFDVAAAVARTLHFFSTDITPATRLTAIRADTALAFLRDAPGGRRVHHRPGHPVDCRVRPPSLP